MSTRIQKKKGGKPKMSGPIDIGSGGGRMRVNCESGFGEGLNFIDSATSLPVERVSSQGAVSSLPDGILYEDEAGRGASLRGLTSAELHILKDKHGL